jgi:plasmid stabilization system protein ParE
MSKGNLLSGAPQRFAKRSREAEAEAGLDAARRGRPRRIFEHLESDSPRAAVKVDDRIVVAVRRLLEFPQSGRPGRVAGTRELVVPHTPFIAAYVATADRIRILCILHGAQVWPDDIDS